MTDALRLLNQKLSFSLGSFRFAPYVFQAAAIIFLLFILILSLAQLRRHFIDWSIKGSIFGIFLGFILALVLEGFLILGGRTVLTEIIGWKNAPKPIVNILDAGRKKLVEVLGISDPIPSSFADAVKSSNEILNDFRKLDVNEAQKVKAIICRP